MTADELFLAVCEDLERLVSIGDEYSMLRASALLRQLMLEGFIHTINQSYRLKLKFPVCGRDFRREVFKHNPVMYTSLTGIHESGSLGHTRELVSERDFLAEPVIVFSGEQLSVRDVIDHAANIMGGVHFGVPTEPKNVALSSSLESVIAYGLPLNATQLRPVVLVTLDGLAELRASCA